MSDYKAGKIRRKRKEVTLQWMEEVEDWTPGALWAEPGLASYSSAKRESLYANVDVCVRLEGNWKICEWHTKHVWTGANVCHRG